VSISLIYALCERRELTHLRVGLPGKRGKILIREEDLDAYLAGLKVEGPKAAPLPSPKPRPLRLNHLHPPA
jgi:hypothetical protein